MIMKWKYRLYILPLSRLRRDPSTAVLLETCDHVMDLTMSLRVGERVIG